MLEMKNGEIIECVIVLESMSDMKVEVPIGKISIPKNTVAKISRYSKGKNDALIEKWRKAKIAHKQKATRESTYIRPKEGEHLIHYKSKWLTMEEYTKIKEKLREKKEEHLRMKEEEFQEQLLQKERVRLKEETIETIEQGRKRRSKVANEILDGDEWLISQSTNFILFFNEDKIPPSLKKIEKVSELFFDKLRGDLNLKKYFSFDEKIEVYLIQDNQLWEKMLKETSQEKNIFAFSNHYKREIFLDITIKEEHFIPNFAHELSHIFLKEFTITNFSKKHFIPLWLNKGFANYEGALFDYSLPKKDLINAIYKNYYIKLDELLCLYILPKDNHKRKLFYAEAASLVDFMLTTHGRKRFNKFITTLIQKYYEEEKHPDKLTVKKVRKILLSTIKETFLADYYAGYSSFEEAWLRYVTA